MTSPGYLLTLAAILLSGCAEDGPGLGFGPKGHYEDQDVREHTLSAGGATFFAAETVNGGIVVRAVDGAAARVVVTRRASAPTQAQLDDVMQRVDARVERNGTVLSAVTEYPKLPADVQIEVSYVIETPALLALSAITVNGEISVSGRSGDVHLIGVNGGISVDGSRGGVRADVVNGSVLVSDHHLSAPVQVAAVNGSVDVRVLDGAASVTGTTVNGSVTVRLPAEFGGTLSARSANGTASCDFPLTGRVASPSHIAGTIGGGGAALVTMRSTNGNVRLGVGS